MITLEKRTTAARALTAQSASLKDWQVRNKHNRAMRELARELTDGGKGYIIATVRELAATYGKLCHYDLNAPGIDVKCIWAINKGITRRRMKLMFTPM